MELKTFQKDVISDLSRYLELVRKLGNYDAAFHSFWTEKEAPELGWYQDTIPGVPAVCFKIPTGGGKTLTATAAVRPVLDALPTTRYQSVVWLVPSLPILEQTLRALKDPRHPYGQRLDADFHGHVEVYSKDELLSGQNFSPGAIADQLSIMVLSYDSFKPRSKRDKEALKAFQDNGALQTFHSVLGKPDHPVDNADEQSLFQVINQLNPIVIVDESHHAKTPLSLDMLRSFNPAVVLEFTATPRPESNVLSYVDALRLKQEGMVKLPMIVYNRREENDVLIDTIALRDTLESLAQENQEKGGQYIRPIALFQAQPRTANNTYTHERVRSELEIAGIDPKWIAVRTADINELKGVNLMSPECPIRYIVTVNALTEGWDCPFAYILASTANRNSRISVEQILGRILRQPYTLTQPAIPLNMSYVLTCSSDFDAVVRDLVQDLHYIGFSGKDCRAIDAPGIQKNESKTERDIDNDDPRLSNTVKWQETSTTNRPTEYAPERPSLDQKGEVSLPSLSVEHSGFNGEAAKEELAHRRQMSSGNPAQAMLDRAKREGKSFDADMRENEQKNRGISTMQDKHMSHIKMRPAFASSARRLQLPQLFIREEPIQVNWFSELPDQPEPAMLDPVNLATGFSLNKAPITMQFEVLDSDVYKIDTDAGGSGVPAAFMQSDQNRQRWLGLFRERAEAHQKQDCVRELLKCIGPFNMIPQKELRAYVKRVVDTMKPDVLAATFISPTSAAHKIRSSIDELLKEYYRKKFRELEKQNRLLCMPSYAFPAEIHPVEGVSAFGNSLYEVEDAHMNNLEQTLIKHLSGMQEVLWWHRNPERKPDSFRINGFINHYPDFIIRTKHGSIFLAETKSLHLNLAASLERIELGRAWERLAGAPFRYYMVFEDQMGLPQDAVTMSDFMQILRNS